METTILLRFRGMSDSSAATRRRRNCRARSDGELRLESEEIYQLIEHTSAEIMPTVRALRYADNLERFHPSQTLLQLLHKHSERRLAARTLSPPRSERVEEQLLTTSRRHCIGVSTRMMTEGRKDSPLHSELAKRCNKPSMTPLCKSSKLDTEVC